MAESANKGKRSYDYWVEEAEKILKDVRKGLLSDERALFVGNGARDGVAGGTRALYWKKWNEESGKWIKMNRTIVGAIFALIASACNEDVIRRANDLWTNGKKMEAMKSYVGDILKNAGLGWLASSAMIYIEKWVLTLFKDGQFCLPFDLLCLPQTSCAQNYLGAGIAGLFTTVFINLMLWVTSQKNNKHKTCLEALDLWKNGILASVNAVFGYVCTSVSLVGWPQLIASAILVWVFQQIIDGVSEAGLFGYIKSWMPKRLVGTKQWKVSRDVQVPEDMCCPITKHPLVDPVSCGAILYERSDIEKWITETGKHPIARDKEISLWSLKPCHAMRILIERFMKENGGVHDYA